MWVLKDQGASLTHHDDSSEGAAAASGLRVDAGERARPMRRCQVTNSFVQALLVVLCQCPVPHAEVP